MTKLTIFYDGTCPLCAKEMKALRQHDHKQEINTVDIYSDAVSDWLYLRFAQNRYRISYWLTGTSRCNSGRCSR
ncbi:DCC1-like thiol-disulfide oxidoreductase family protein [Vibrio parahaemolyticus]|uniref:DCC1-like thiol-disulfide oxidoreductase family protein n=1 Tax=Vibrio parahaemolyticus TaxID=670 RepID=UPI0009AA1021|nr:DCC1-like thiol-disulfide oxidoreductase family protein [Vibrio parahaemolyticus]